MELLLQQKGFGAVTPDSLRMGAELEMYIVDQEGQPLGINLDLLHEAQDSQLTLELNRYNLEYNLTPYSLQQKPFESTEQEISAKLKQINQIAQSHQAKVIPIGILPTLKPCHLGSMFLTDRERYRILVRQLVKRRGCDFQIDINGKHPLQMAMRDITLEGANTSFQIHYRVEPDHYVDCYNAFQMVSPLVLALSANSPCLFGHELWQETRIPLFKQSIDARIKDRYQWHEPARVDFGQGWLRRSALEIFQQTVSLYPALLPICSDEDATAQFRHKMVPQLAELRLHQGTVWTWNRPVYDPEDGGHLRIELRALPSGPTAIDMSANAAFYIGLAEAYKDKMQSLLPALPFLLAEYNFYRAAQFGLKAQIVWPDMASSGCKQQPIIDVLMASLDQAKIGLQSIGISESESQKYIGVIQTRLERQVTGADWQIRRVAHYHRTHSKEESLRLMLMDYINNSLANIPVSEW